MECNDLGPKRYPLPVYDYTDKEVKIWLVPESVHRLIAEAKRTHRIPTDEGLSVEIKVIESGRGHKAYQVVPILTRKQRLRKWAHRAWRWICLKFVT